MPCVAAPVRCSPWLCVCACALQEWFAWLEENLDRGSDSLELLKILAAKGFAPHKNPRLMQFIAAHDSLTVTTSLPVMVRGGRDCEYGCVSMCSCGYVVVRLCVCVVVCDCLWLCVVLCGLCGCMWLCVVVCDCVVV